MDIWQNFRDRDYLRWRRKRRFVRLLLTAVTIVLLAPILAIYEYFKIRSALGFIFLAGCVLFLLAVYRALGLLGRPYRPPDNH
ncbi:MAG TPA: hypothetical protein VJ783_23385 [Pirellulales bacterium]|nr:hypothetical protein [Pirellulales bacterium]